MSPETTGEWREERLYVLRAIEDLKAEQRRQIEAEAGTHHIVAVKAAKDIGAAHDKIRALESTGTILTIKNWVMATALTTITSVAIVELVKWILHQ
jgi:hypothetical protein